MLKAAISKSAMQVRKSRKSLLRRINVSRRSSKSNIHKITRIISTAGVYPLIKKALDNILGCRFIISFPCNQIKSNLAEQKLYHNMGKMSQKFMLRLTLRQQSYKIKAQPIALYWRERMLLKQSAAGTLRI